MDVAKVLKENIMSHLNYDFDKCSVLLTMMIESCDSLNSDGLALARYDPDEKTKVNVIEPTKPYIWFCPSHIFDGTFENKITYNPPIKKSIVKLKSNNRKKIVNYLSVFPMENKEFLFEIYGYYPDTNTLFLRPSYSGVSPRGRGFYMEQVEDEIPINNKRLERLQRLTEELNSICKLA